MKIHMLSSSERAVELYEASARVFGSIPPLALLQDIVPDVLEGGYTPEQPYAARYDEGTALDRWYASGWLGGEAYLAPQPCEAYVSTLDDLPTVVVEGVTPTACRRWQAVFDAEAKLVSFSIIADGGSQNAFGLVLAKYFSQHLQKPLWPRNNADVQMELRADADPGFLSLYFVVPFVVRPQARHGDFEVAGVRITPATSVVETRSA